MCKTFEQFAATQIFCKVVHSLDTCPVDAALRNIGWLQKSIVSMMSPQMTEADTASCESIMFCGRMLLHVLVPTDLENADAYDDLFHASPSQKGASQAALGGYLWVCGFLVVVGVVVGVVVVAVVGVVVGVGVVVA